LLTNFISCGAESRFKKITIKNQRPLKEKFEKINEAQNAAGVVTHERGREQDKTKERRRVKSLSPVPCTRV
jgi:hypothetical protein